MRNITSMRSSVTLVAWLAMVGLCGCDSGSGLKNHPAARKDASLDATLVGLPGTYDAGPDRGKNATTDAAATDTAMARDTALLGDTPIPKDTTIAYDGPSRGLPEVPWAPTDADGNRRLQPPCTAPLPTGFCLVSDPGDYVGRGKNISGSGKTSVTARIFRPLTTIPVGFVDPTTLGAWNLYLEAPVGKVLALGTFDPAERSPGANERAAGLYITGNGAGCNTLTGRFSIEEMQRDPTGGLVRFSATFEQHCEGATPALRGVVNYQASGIADPMPAAVDGHEFPRIFGHGRSANPSGVHRGPSAVAK